MTTIQDKLGFQINAFSVLLSPHKKATMNLRMNELILKLCCVFGVYTVDLGKYFTEMSFHLKRRQKCLRSKICITYFSVGTNERSVLAGFIS